MVTDAERARIHALPDRPEQDLAELSALAEQVAQDWPEHPVSEHARLVLLRTILPRGETHDPQEVAERLLAIGDPEIQEQAALLVTRERFEPVSPPLLRLLDTMEQLPTGSLQNELRITTWALNRAVLLQDWSRAQGWSQRLRAALEEGCGVPEPHHSLSCDTRQLELQDVSARLVALGLQDPSSWQEALTAAAWRCHLEVAPHNGFSHTVALWDGQRWSFGPWTSPDGATRCLDELERTEIVPDRPLQVDLIFEGTTSQ